MRLLYQRVYFDTKSIKDTVSKYVPFNFNRVCLLVLKAVCLHTHCQCVRETLFTCPPETVFSVAAVLSCVIGVKWGYDINTYCFFRLTCLGSFVCLSAILVYLSMNCFLTSWAYFSKSFFAIWWIGKEFSIYYRIKPLPFSVLYICIYLCFGLLVLFMIWLAIQISLEFLCSQVWLLFYSFCISRVRKQTNPTPGFYM